MIILNRLNVFFKRILCRKTYICMLAFLIILTTTYKLLPAKKQTADIKVAIYNEEINQYSEDMYACFDEINTLYNFYPVDSKNELIDVVQSGKVECGFFIPADFYINYISGSNDTPIVMYNTPASTLSSAICETLFSCILKVCSPDILTYAVDATAHNQYLMEKMEEYINSDEIFTLESLADGEFSFHEETYHINIPVYEISIILIIFASLLGLLIYLQDKEKGIFTALSRKELHAIKLVSIFTALFPILVVGFVCNIIISGLSHSFSLLLISLVTFIATIISSLIIRKSTHLNKVLPLVMLISIIVIFLETLI